MYALALVVLAALSSAGQSTSVIPVGDPLPPYYLAAPSAPSFGPLSIFSLPPSSAQICSSSPLVAESGQTVSDSRSTSAYCVDASGVLHLLGANVARVEASGLVDEGAGSNGFTQSNNFSDAAWAVSGTLSATQNQTGPDGVANSAWTLSISGPSGNSIYQFVGTGTEVESLYVNPSLGTARYVAFVPSADGLLYYDCQTQTWTAASGAATGHSQTLGNGWIRLWATTTNGAAAFTKLSWRQSSPPSNPELEAPDESTLVAWNAQVESGFTNPSSPMISGASNGSRDTDRFSVPWPASLLNVNFTMQATVLWNEPETFFVSRYPTIFQVYSASGANERLRLFGFFDASPGEYQTVTTEAGGSTNTSNTSVSETFGASTVRKYQLVWTNATNAQTTNVFDGGGSLLLTASGSQSGPGMTDAATLYIGFDILNQRGAPFGWISKITVTTP